MGRSDLLELVNRWETGGSEAAHRRLAALIETEPGGRPLGEDTLGQRNRRLIALHGRWIDRPIEAHVACPTCGTGNEFVLPLEAMQELPDPPPGARTKLGGSAFRLPTMAEAEACGADPAALARRCADDPAVRLDAQQLAMLSEAFDALDPLGRLTVASHCSDCGGEVTAEVDLAEFVAAELTRCVELALRDIDLIAAAYGWSEREILSLPADRRARYVAMIAGRRGPRALGGEAAA